MSELVFALKMAGIALVVVVLMQVRVGDESIESHAHTFIQTAAPIIVLREVAEGGLSALHDGWAKATANIKTKYGKKFDPENVPGQRQFSVMKERSGAYLDEQKAKRDKLEAEMASRAKKVRQAIGLEGEDEPALPESTEE